MIGYIYQIHNNITGQSYIGQTIDIYRRIRTHLNKLRNNTHVNPKLQASWNKYGEENFSITHWSFQISALDELDKLECEYIEKYNSQENGYNLTPGGTKPPKNQKVRDEDVATFLCVYDILGEGYGKTCEQIFGWSKGTASAAKRKIRYAGGWFIYEQLTPDERQQRGQDFIKSQDLKKITLERQLTQGGSKQAYLLCQDDYNFAFCAQELGYSAVVVSRFLEISEATVYDWFNGRHRKKEKNHYLNLPEETKERIRQEVQEANLPIYEKNKLITKKEEDVIDYLCFLEFYPPADKKVERFFGWADGSCYQLKKNNSARAIKYKQSLMNDQEKLQRADKLNQSMSRPL